MITKVNNTISFLKNLFIETFINKTDKVTDISDNSVLNGVAYGVAKTAQKAIKDIAIVETQIFPETASGEWLDRSAKLFGVPPRRGALGSSTYVRVYATLGTYYEKGVNTFINTNGIRFEIEESVTVGESGYAYVRVRSEGVGKSTNVEANSILRVAPVPYGHISCTNEYYAIGGRDVEDDEMFRRRLLNHQNSYATATIEKLNQILQRVDDRILKIMYIGYEEDSFLHIKVITQNGQVLFQEELDSLKEAVKPYLSLGDFTINNGLSNIVFENAEWHFVGGSQGIDFRCSINSEYSISEVRKNIQIALTKHFDWRFWEMGRKIEWDDILMIVKGAEGVSYVDSDSFLPNKDEVVPDYKLPRISKFVMRNLDGSVLYDSEGQFPPLFYPL